MASFGVLQLLTRALVVTAMLWSDVALGQTSPLSYPQIIRTRYEAKDPKVGGHLVVWVEREKIWYGLDPRLYPPVKYVEITHITPSQGSPSITTIEVTNINSTIPEFYHITGIARLKVTGMFIAATNAPK